MNEAYSTLAAFYDLSMEVDYEEWVRYLLALSSQHDHSPENIVDLGCGTGNLTFPLAKLGYQLTGVDLSHEMIAMAEAKRKTLGQEISFFVQDLREFSLAGEPFDTAISGCDVLNYMTSKADLSRSFQAVHRILQPGGLWLFDLNSEYKLSTIYGNEAYADLQVDFAYFWDNHYDPQAEVCTMDLTFFVRTKKGVYERKTEQHQQKLWRPEDIEAQCKESGFELLGCYDFLTTDPCSFSSERWQFLARRS